MPRLSDGLDDPQAHRVERVVDGRGLLELRLVGLDLPDAARIRLRATGS
jgi:hypothetical protein